MRKFGFLILSLIISVNAFSAEFILTHLSKGLSGNNRYPGICENDLGERLVIWRSHNRGMFFSYFNDGSWSRPEAIPHQLEIDGDYLGSDIVADSDSRFHVIWELMDEAVFYATFKDGVWTDPVKVRWPARYEGFQISMDMRSDEELAVVSTCRFGGKYKDITIGYLRKGESNFSRFKNLTDDKESSSTAAIAFDANDHAWIAYKGEVFGLGHEILRTCVIHLNEENKMADFAQPSAEQDGFAFLQWVAANKITGVVMATWWCRDGFYSRWYNQATEKWSPITRIGVSSARHADFSMWNKIVAQGKDFYCLAKNSPHELYIVKFNGETENWETPILVYEKPTVYFDLYPANGNLLIAFCTRDAPTQVYFTSMVGSYEPPKIRVKSAVNVRVETKSERSFFRGFYFNYITWENNPWNIEHDVAIDHFNLYRKLKTETEYGSTPYQANIPASQLYFEDKQGIQETPLYDYAVTCVITVNGETFESEIEY